MKYLTIDYIKEHSRIDFSCEDEVLERMGDAAEAAVLSLCGRTIEDLLEEYGEVPPAVVHATLMLVDNLYQHRSPVEPVQLSTVPYGFDLMVKPYMRL